MSCYFVPLTAKMETRHVQTTIIRFPKKNVPPGVRLPIRFRPSAKGQDGDDGIRTEATVSQACMEARNAADARARRARLLRRREITLCSEHHHGRMGRNDLFGSRHAVHFRPPGTLLPRNHLQHAGIRRQRSHGLAGENHRLVRHEIRP